MSNDDSVMIVSSDATESDRGDDWSFSIDGADDVVDSGVSGGGGVVTVQDPSTPVSINSRGMLEQGVVRAVARIVDTQEQSTEGEASTSGRATGVLIDNPVSVVTHAHLAGIRTMYGIPEDVELRAARRKERADWDIPGWTCFYEYTLRWGFRFPVPTLVRQVLTHFDIAPGQLMPNGWRIMLSLSVLCESRKIKLSLGRFLYNYYLKEHTSDKGRYIVVLKAKAKEPLITETTSNDRNWKDTYFFAKGPPVDGPWGKTGYRVPRVWARNSKCRLRLKE